MANQISGVDFGLLKFCLAHSDSPNVEDTDLSKYNRDPADYAWLKEALSNLEGDATKVRKLLDELRAPGISAENSRYALEGIQYYVEDVDVANAVLKANVLQIISSFLTHPDKHLRMWSAWTIGTICHNNPTAQKAAMEINLLGTIIAAFQNETDPAARHKQIAAISAVLSQNIPGQKLFVESYNGVSLLTSLLDDPDQTIKSRAMWLANNIMFESPDTKELFGNSAFIQKLINNINSESPIIFERALQTLKTLITDNTKNIAQAKALGVDKIVQQKLQELQNNASEDNNDEIELLKQINNLLVAG